jgi:hypothetical protein
VAEIPPSIRPRRFRGRDTPSIRLGATAFERLLGVESGPRAPIDDTLTRNSQPSKVAVEAACRQYLAMAEAVLKAGAG